MAMQINAGEKVRRGDIFWVDPNEVIVKEELRGRRVPPTPEKIIEMALSLNEHGQRQPVECRKVAGNRLQLVLGFTRTAAARLLIAGFEHQPTNAHGQPEGDPVFVQDPDFRLKVVITDADDKRAFLNNIVENAHRNETSPIDDAWNHAILRDKYGYGDQDIAHLYQYKSTSRVTRLRRLLELSEGVQARVHTGDLSVAAALELLDLPEEKREETLAVVEGASLEGEKVSASVLREVVRDEILRDSEEREKELTLTNAPKTAPKMRPRSMREVRDFLTRHAAGSDLPLAALCGQLLDFLAGKSTDEALLDSLHVLLSTGDEEGEGAQLSLEDLQVVPAAA